MSLRGNIVTVAISCLLFVLVACGDDDSDFATRPSDDSSSSVCEDCDDESSSSSSSVEPSSSVVGCKTETEDNCEYGKLVDDRDRQTYKTVKIGDQVWMAENLNFETDSSFCYNDSAEYCEKYGRLYTWAAAMDSAGTWSTNGKGCGYGKTCSVASTGSATLIRGVCPDGWHLPTQTEWNTLFATVGGSSVAGTKLKSTSGWNSSTNGTDAFGFSALPAGYRIPSGYFFTGGYSANFWSSTEYGSYNAYYMYLGHNNDYASLDGLRKDYRFSVRGLKD